MVLPSVKTQNDPLLVELKLLTSMMRAATAALAKSGAVVGAGWVTAKEMPAPPMPLKVISPLLLAVPVWVVNLAASAVAMVNGVSAMPALTNWVSVPTVRFHCSFW